MTGKYNIIRQDKEGGGRIFSGKTNDIETLIKKWSEFFPDINIQKINDETVVTLITDVKIVFITRTGRCYHTCCHHQTN